MNGLTPDKKLNISAVLRGQKILWDADFIFAPAQQRWIYLVLATELLLAVLQPVLTSPLMLLIFAVNLFLVPITVNTHRFMLLKEQPQRSADRLGPRFLLASLKVSFPFIAVILLALTAVLLFATPANPTVFYAISVWLALLLLGFFMTFFVAWPPMLTLPPLACGTALSRADAFAAVKGHWGALTRLSLTLFSVVFTTAFIVAVAMDQVKLLLARLGLPLLGRLLEAVTTGILDVAAAMAAAGVLSLVYKALVERDRRYLE